MQALEGLSGISLQSLPIYLLLLMISSLRIGAFLVASPFFGSRMIPLTVRIVFAIAFGIGLVSHLKFPPVEFLVGVKLVPIIFQELFIGIACGLVLNILFSSVILAGEKIAATSGLAFAAQIDPTSGAQSPVISQIFQLFLLILFFSVNGHLIVFELFYKSYEMVPIGSFYNFKDVIEEAINSTNSIYQNAVIIVLPIVSILFFMNLGIGFITKSAPQLNLFSFGFPLTILGTFFALYFSVDALQYVFSGLIDEAIGYVKLILNGGGADG
jgi:flagellar biosynthetic protein FliR